MNRKNLTAKIIKNTILSLAFPILIFVTMLIITATNKSSYVNGNFIFLTYDLPRQVLLKASLTTCVALAIWIQLKNGRFDFSGGATMILTAIIAGNIGKSSGYNPWIILGVALIVGLILSLITATAYIIGRLPIIICTIGMTLLYESLTYVLFQGTGIVGIFSNVRASLFGRLPWIFLPLIIAVFVFTIFSYFTVEGRKGKILANNQTAGVHIGINESKNIIITYIFSGILIGLAAVIYVSQNDIKPMSGLASSGILFSYIVPVFIGVFIGHASFDVLGIFIAAIGMEILNYGLNTINRGGGGWQQIILGVFMLSFYAFSTQAPNINKVIKHLSEKLKSEKSKG